MQKVEGTLKKRERRLQNAESTLIERAREGEDRAMDLLVRRHQPVVERRVRQLCRNEADAEDIAQEVMITLFRRLDKFQGKSSLATWLYRVTTNAFLMHERGQRRHRSAVTDRELQEKDGVTFGWDDFGHEDPFSNVHGKELLEIFSEKIEQLPKRYREVFRLRRFEELTLEEVSQRIQISVMGVKSRQYRAKEMLKKEMRDTEWLEN